MKMNSIWKIAFFSLAAIIMMIMNGCTGSNFVGTSSSTDPGAMPPVSSFADELQDIEIPIDLTWERNKSLAIKTESFRGGIWHYSGKVEAVSLKDFMITAMQNNKWKLVGEVASKEILLAFIKPGKNCMMIISDVALGKTELTLYVTVDETAAAGLNPFGEAVTR